RKIARGDEVGVVAVDAAVGGGLDLDLAGPVARDRELAARERERGRREVDAAFRGGGLADEQGRLQRALELEVRREQALEVGIGNAHEVLALDREVQAPLAKRLLLDREVRRALRAGLRAAGEQVRLDEENAFREEDLARNQRRLVFLGRGQADVEVAR